MKAHEKFVPWAELEGKLKSLEIALDVNDVSVIRFMMKKLMLATRQAVRSWIGCI
jgi:hypothetical protein